MDVKIAAPETIRTFGGRRATGSISHFSTRWLVVNGHRFRLPKSTGAIASANRLRFTGLPKFVG